MRISLVFPFLALAVLRLRTRWSILIAAGLSLSFVPLSWLFSSTLHLCSSQAALNSTITLHFAAFFILGSLLAKNLHRVNGWYKRLHPFAAAILALVAFLVYCGTNSDIVSRHLRIRGDFYDWGTATGALMIMILAMNASLFHAFLTSRFIHHLGKISYSLYLMHATVLFSLVHTLRGRIPMTVLLLIYLAITLVITEIFYLLIEHPTMLLGRRLTAPRSSRQPLPATI
jgi:peptidoglycan/LPS O-acetylase OafA/YrhL